MSILKEIFTHKREEVARRIHSVPLENIQAKLEGRQQAGNFIRALISAEDQPALIAEIKRKSPSKGVLRADFEPLFLAECYQENGAAAISVLTDNKYFGGSLSDLEAVNQFLASTDSPPPTLRKDFIFSEYQIAEAAAAGASAVLLIAAELDARSLEFLIEKAADYRLAALVETHTAGEVEKALDAGAELIGINNRDLHTFEVDIQTTISLRQHIPPNISVISESGIKTPEDVERLKQNGIDAILVGETLVTHADPAAAIRMLRGQA